MYQGKHMKKTRKPAVLLASLALAVTVAVAGTLAFLATQTQPVKNTFTPTNTPPTVVEKIEGAVKEEVAIKNEGNIDAYVRAIVAVNWVNETGDIYGVPPVQGTDYTVTGFPASTKWTQGEDGFFYYTEKVSAGGTTDNLLTGCAEGENANKPNGYSLSVEVLAQTIQADGVAADGETPPVVAAWGAENGGSVTGVSNGNLQIKTEGVSGE